MFKVGDKVVCIHNISNSETTIWKKYKVVSSTYKKYITIIDESGNYRDYKMKHFKLVKEYRKQKINNLISIL